MPAHGALGKNVGLWPGEFLQGAANDLFRVAQAVDCRRVDPVDPELQSPVDCRNGLVIVLWAPGELPVATANGPCAKSDRSEVKVRVAERAKGG